MIRSLTGILTDVTDTSVIIEVYGVGYLVGCPTRQHNLKEGDRITLHTYLAVRENSLDLYGFPDLLELRVFEMLLGIPKIGPKSALQIITQASPKLLTEATQKADASYLHKLSGIGKKTCENIILHLANKLDRLPAIGDNLQNNLSTIQTDAIDTLITLGYEAVTAREVILALEQDGAETINSLVTKALKHIN